MGVSQSLATISSAIPSPIKYTALVLLLLNIRSFPLVWHFKVFYPAIRGYILGYWKGSIRHVRELPSTGANPWELKTKKTFWAAFDDIDWNGHLSNSRYAMHLDALRMQACAEFWAPFFMAGGWVGLGNSSYSFITEVPALAMCEIEMKMGGIDDKWVHLEATFLTKGGKKGGKGVREDGKTVRCVAITSYCFKVGRLTIPPAVVLSWCCFGRAANLERFVKLYSKGTPKDKKNCQAWLKEGWKDEQGVLDEFESEGKKRGEGAKAGMEGMKTYGGHN